MQNKIQFYAKKSANLYKIGILEKEKIGKENFYINIALYELLMEQ